MCGLAGILQPTNTQVDRRLLTLMRDSLIHRGPDDAHSVVIDTQDGTVRSREQNGTGNLGLGFRRLSILDLSLAGRQPMSNADETIWLVFNGEIYNFKDLRQELEARGATFASQSDTEVIIALYEMDGPAAVARLNGMFAYALWDQRRCELHLARDRLGIKPLYYTWCDDTLLFASELKAILQHKGVSRELDPTAVVQCFSFQSPIQKRTLFRDIELLEPGTQITVTTDGKTRTETFWRPETTYLSHPIETFAAELRDTFTRTIRRQLQSDVPVGFFLSGGIDTGSIGVLASHQSPHRMASFTCGFDVSEFEGNEAYFDERPEARELAKYLGTQHHELELAPSAIESLISDTMWHLEEPQAGISYQIFATAALVRDHVSVVLSGVGGDELFAGYPWRYETIQGLDDGVTFEDLYFKEWCRLVPAGHMDTVLADGRISDADAAVRSGYDVVMTECQAPDTLGRALLFDLKTLLHSLLMVEDRLTMAHGLESRVPITDNEILDLALNIPAAMKFDGRTAKKVMRTALRGLLPDAVLHRRKQGFTPPDASWYRQHNWAFVQGTLTSEQFTDRGWFKPNSINSILETHRSGSTNHRHLIWSLLAFEWMHRLLIDPEHPHPPNDV